jgi:hypothetical protein
MIIVGARPGLAPTIIKKPVRDCTRLSFPTSRLKSGEGLLCASVGMAEKRTSGGCENMSRQPVGLFTGS